jgi:hypothetical protein
MTIWFLITVLVQQLGESRKETIRLKSELEQARMALHVSDAHRLDLQEQLTIAHMKSMH